MHLDWMVIGAGPAGIAAIGKLLDHHIPSNKIGWMDPEFKVGSLGKHWKQVPSNTTVKLFLQFLNACQSFNYKKRPHNFILDALPENETCLLERVVEPLQWVTHQLQTHVHTFQQMAVSLKFQAHHWEIETAEGILYAKNVILAIGSEPKSLAISHVPSLPLETGLDPTLLAESLSADDTIGVFGSSHSAILVLANLQNLSLKKVYHFYRSPHRYAVYLKDWILFDDSGLKGFSAEWARKHLDGHLPPNYERIHIQDHRFSSCLADCSKVIHAVGFERRHLPTIEPYSQLSYDDKTGLIAPHLYGFGIAFPQAKFDPLGHLEFRVGLWKFMDYLETILPIWLAASKN